MAQITDLLVEAIAAKLVEDVQDVVDSDDPTYVEVLRPGLLQENPLSNRTSLTVHLGDPDEIDQDAWPDEVVQPGDAVWPNTPMFEIGNPVSGIFWWRRGTIKVDIFLIKTKEDRATAREVSNTIRARIERSLRIRAQEYQGLEDAHGEQVILFMPAKSYAREGGGPGQHIWRVYVWWQAMTEQSAA